jgi:hypothetical protein
MISLKYSIEINASADKVFNQLVENLSNRESYKLWHPEHVDLRWIQGEPLREGSILYAEEYLHGNLHKLKFRVKKIVPNKKIAYAPLFPLSIIATGNSFRTVSKGENRCVFFSEGYIRFPLWLFKKVHKSHEDKLIASEKHMKEECENIKKAVETAMTI